MVVVEMKVKCLAPKQPQSIHSKYQTYHLLALERSFGYVAPQEFKPCKTSSWRGQESDNGYKIEQVRVYKEGSNTSSFGFSPLDYTWHAKISWRSFWIIKRKKIKLQEQTNSLTITNIQITGWMIKIHSPIGSIQDFLRGDHQKKSNDLPNTSPSPT